MTLSTTYGVQKVMCARMTETYPWLKCRNTNSRNSETPVMMSGLIIGMLFRKVIACFLRPLRLWMPMAATVPRIVENRAAMMAISSVFSTAASRELFPCILPVSRFW